jgi:hypothetical protein
VICSYCSLAHSNHLAPILFPMDCRCCLICQKWSPAAPGKRFRNSAQKRSLFRDQSCSQHKVEMSGDTPDFSIEPEGGMISPSQFTYDGHQVEIVPPDTVHLIGNFWQIKIDGVLQHEFLFSSSRVAADQARKLIDQERRSN